MVKSKKKTKRHYGGDRCYGKKQERCEAIVGGTERRCMNYIARDGDGMHCHQHIASNENTKRRATKESEIRATWQEPEKNSEKKSGLESQ
jgi:hypothetical protein